MTTNDNGHIEHDSSDRTVFACPRCGEDRIDQLVWIDDDTVRCTTCGTEYEPNPDANE